MKSKAIGIEVIFTNTCSLKNIMNTSTYYVGSNIPIMTRIVKPSSADWLTWSDFSTHTGNMNME